MKHNYGYMWNTGTAAHKTLHTLIVLATEKSTADAYAVVQGCPVGTMGALSGGLLKGLVETVELD